MSEKKYVVIPFESAERAAGFYNDAGAALKLWGAGPGMRLLDADEYPTKRHNGWTNYETWAVKLWLDNEQGSHEYWREASQEVWNEATSGEYEWQTREQQAAYALSKRLEDEHEEAAQERTGEASVFTDLLNAALSEVNWSEIAESLLEDVDKTEGTDESEDANV